jgi:hypothetical protein
VLEIHRQIKLIEQVFQLLFDPPSNSQHIIT